MVPYLFGHHELHMTREGAAYWRAQKALLVADLHLEKSSFFAKTGQMLPPYDSIATLDRLADVIARTGARAVWCLGDSFHDADGFERLPEPARALLTAFTERLDWVWITGNHDALFNPGVGRCVAEMLVDDITLRHEARSEDPGLEISGHYHPKIRLRHKGQHLARPCYMASPTKLILPAFGALTGGLSTTHPAFRDVLGADAVALVPGPQGLMRFPLDAAHTAASA